jgi:hypothetical protein
MGDPDSIVQYVTWLDRRYNRLVDAVFLHRASKRDHSIPGTIDNFDRELWDTLDSVYDPAESE